MGLQVENRNHRENLMPYLKVEKVCVGYEGHECGVAFTARKSKRIIRCPECQKKQNHISSNKWSKTHDRVQKHKPSDYNNNYRKVKAVGRLKKVNAHTVGSLQHLPGESFASAVNAILRGRIILTEAK
jgi:hypothetical protein